MKRRERDTAEVTFILLKEIDYFGKQIPKGVRFELDEKNSDYYIPRFQNSIYPGWALHFTLVHQNPDYFIKVNW